MGKVWEIDKHNMGNACVFSSIPHNVGKDSQTHQIGKVWEIVPGNILQNPLYVENLGNWYSYFSHSMGTFLPLDSHSMVYFIICEIHGLPHQPPIASNWEILGNWYPFFP